MLLPSFFFFFFFFICRFWATPHRFVSISFKFSSSVELLHIFFFIFCTYFHSFIVFSPIPCWSVETVFIKRACIFTFEIKLASIPPLMLLISVEMFYEFDKLFGFVIFFSSLPCSRSLTRSHFVCAFSISRFLFTYRSNEWMCVIDDREVRNLANLSIDHRAKRKASAQKFQCFEKKKWIACRQHEPLITVRLIKSNC